MFFPERSVDIPEDTLCPDSSEPTVEASETQQTDMSSTAEVATTSADNGVIIETSNPVETTDEVASSNTNTIGATNTVTETESVDASKTAAVNTETTAETNAIVGTTKTVVVSGSDETSQTIVTAETLQTVDSQSIQPSEVQSTESMQSIVEQTTPEPQGCSCQNGGTPKQEGVQCTCQCTNTFTGDKCDSKYTAGIEF